MQTKKITKPLVSVIIPAYNAESHLDECLRSVRSQSYDNIEILVVNDGSTDKTDAIIKRHEKADDRVVGIRQRNSGVCSARNNAISKMRGSFVLFVDADDVIAKDNIEKNINIIVKDGSDIVVDSYVEFSDKTRKEIILNKTADSFEDCILNEKSKVGGFAWNKFLRREYINSLFDESIAYYENLLFFLVNTKKNTKYSVVSEPLYYYRNNPNSVTHTKAIGDRQVSAIDALGKIVEKVSGTKYADFYRYRLYVKYKNLLYLARKSETVKREIKVHGKKNNIRAFPFGLLFSTNLSISLKIRLIIISISPAFDEMIKNKIK